MNQEYRSNSDPTLVWRDGASLTYVRYGSRLEASSEPGRVQVSASIAVATTGAFVVEPRGQINLKGKGSTETFFLVGRTLHSGRAGP